MKNRNFKFLFSITFLILALLKVFNSWFNSRIDFTVISIILIAFLPWLAKYLKSLEVFGVKATFNIEKDEKDIVEDGINKIESEIKQNKNIIGKNDKNFINLESYSENYNDSTKIVLIRYELEKKLKNICKLNNIDSSQMSINRIVKILIEKKLITENMGNTIIYMMPFLNTVVHSENISFNSKDLDWLCKKGNAIILYLNLVTKIK